MANKNLKFGTTINCMDGRSLEATVVWMKAKYGLDFIDSITEPGMDAFELHMTPEQRAWLKRKLEISIKNHGSRFVSVVGHEDCAGNPVERNVHEDDIRKGVEVVHSLVKEIDPILTIEVVGLWTHGDINPRAWIAEKIT